MSDAIIERNRRAVYHALTTVFTDRALSLRALDVWDRQFADQRGFRVNLYVNAVAQDIVLNDVQVRALASALYAAMTTPEKNLPHLPSAVLGRYAEPAPMQPSSSPPPSPPPSPIQQSSAAQSGAQQTVASHSVAPQPVVPRLPPQPATPPLTDVSMQTGVINPRLAVFTALIAAMIEGAVREKKFDDFLEALGSQKPSLVSSSTQARTVWINGGLTKLRQFVNTLKDAERRIVVNDLYVALCDACGPVVADRILANAVQATERSPEARFCSPREFL